MNDNDGRPYSIVSHKHQHIGRFNIVMDEFEKDGIVYPFSYTADMDCVVILPMIRLKVIMIHQYRHALNNWYWEIPAGGRGNMVPEEAARRELLEETGYDAEQLMLVGKHPLSLGTSSGYVYYFVAECTKSGERMPEPSEEIDEVREFSFNEFEDMINRGEYVQREGIYIWMMKNQWYSAN